MGIQKTILTLTCGFGIGLSMPITPFPIWCALIPLTIFSIILFSEISKESKEQQID